MDPLVGLTFGFTGVDTSSADAPRGGSGSQVLPVAEIDVDQFSGIPADGSEYLYMVRLEAKGLPDITRVELVQVEAAVQEDDAAMLDRIESVPSSRPSEAWRDAFLVNFRGFRERLNATPATKDSRVPSRRHVDAWSTLIRGQLYDPAEDNDDDDGEMTLEQVKAAALAALDTLDDESTTAKTPVYKKGKEPVPPTPSMMASIDQATVMKVLSYANDWFEEAVSSYDELLTDPDLANMAIEEALAMYRPPLPSPNEAIWLLSLLGRLDDLLDGNDLSLLRQLCRTLMSMAQTSQVVRSNRTEIGRSKEDREKDEKDAEGRAACWMVVAAVVGIWKQTDLWDGGL